MLEKILLTSIKQRWLMIGIAVLVTIIGIKSLVSLPIDAVPDITNVQVQINSEASGYSPFETEQRVTFPIETAMAGIPGLEQTRSISRYGLSQVTVIFKDGTDIYFARQLISERLQQVRSQLPSGIDPTMGPIATGLGEIFMYSVRPSPAAVKADGSKYLPHDLREIQDWIIKPQLRNVQGVTEVNSIGGFEKQFHIAPFPERLLAYNLSYHDVVAALEANNSNVGAGYIEKNGEQFLIRIPGQVNTISEIERIVVKNVRGVPVLIRDVADIGYGLEQRTGAATQDGQEVVIGTVLMLMGENSRTVAKAVALKIDDIKKSLPAGIELDTIYNRTNLVDKTIKTVAKNLVEGALLVVAVLFFFLGNIRAAILTAMVIPLSMFITAFGMVQGKISGNLMSLGALDFGLIVDGAIIIVENCIKHLAEKSHQLNRNLTLEERMETVYSATMEVRQATMFGELIIMAVYIPILTLSGVEGKMFFPMAFTVLAALFGAMILSVTFVPAAVALFLSGKVEEKENKVVSAAESFYKTAQDFVFRFKNFTVTALGCLVVSCIVLFFCMGSEFIPSLDEGDVAMHAMRVPGTSLTQSVAMQQKVEREIKSFPEVLTVFSKIGTAEVATDPMPPNVADTFVMLKPKSEWRDSSNSIAQLINQLEHYLKDLPGNQYEFTQPIQMRFNELISGVRSDVGIKVFGDDMDLLLETAEKISGLIQTLPGASDVKVEQVSGLPVMSVNLNRDMLSRVGLNVGDVQNVVNAAIGGVEAGKVFEGDRRFPLFVRLPEDLRSNLKEIERLPIPIPDHGDTKDVRSASNIQRHVTLSTVAKLKVNPGPNQISRENGKRRIVVTANVRGRDLGGFVEDARKLVNQKIKAPDGYWIEWGGQFEQLLSASARLKLVVPIVLLLIIVLLYVSFRDLKDSILVFSGVPFALTGGLIAIWVRDIPLSISAGVGFIALSGVAVLNGLVMITFIQRTRREGLSIEDAARQGALARLRPVLMTALVASLGFIPMALATGTGSEVQRPLATVVIGGIISSTVLTLLILPLSYVWVHSQEFPG
ncbi:MAG: CusA/CzcA family heavy metal efflux RND transporter, partial [Proteobacteria bacterium]|nr:CusA/CzcA family heavy metal efflux RND transporter [Pseudomonadota bacterium]